MLLEEMTTAAVKKHLTKDTLAVIPIGACEQHGPQNPLGTDFMIAQYVARTACERADAVCAPSMPIGVSEHHSNFEGTLWFSPRLVVELMMEYSFNLASHGFDHLIFLNGHGGNIAALQEVARSLYFHHDFKAVLANWWEFLDDEKTKELFPNYAIANAEAIETSVNLALHEHLVDMDVVPNIQPAPKWGRELLGVQLPSYTDDFAEDGVAGNLDNISKESGEKILEMAVIKCAEFIEAYRKY
ncbi:MAG: creatininase family protein [Candidatus Thorarchaeota archaeon]